MIDTVIQPAVFQPFGRVTALQTMRHGGVSPEPFTSLNFGPNTGDTPENLDANTQRLCIAMNIPPESIATAEQVHGTEICHVTEGGLYSGYDAFITATPGIFPGILTADCFPVLLLDPVRNAVAAIHAGWKGTVGAISRITLHAMQKAFGTDPRHCFAWIGTGISARAYEVGEDVAKGFAVRYLRPSQNDRYLLDLAGVNRDQLVDAGIPSIRISASPFCTFLDNRHFYSYRKEQGRTGRMLTLIGIRPLYHSSSQQPAPSRDVLQDP
ncbi:MAG: peptidoglycan editing factor PgeF [Prosthecochloris sp.]|nr:peptidoglycan editing factor PgeF [Prosthecochloris sp.]